MTDSPSGRASGTSFMASSGYGLPPLEPEDQQWTYRYPPNPDGGQPFNSNKVIWIGTRTYPPGYIPVLESALAGLKELSIEDRKKVLAALNDMFYEKE